MRTRRLPATTHRTGATATHRWQALRTWVLLVPLVTGGAVIAALPAGAAETTTTTTTTTTTVKGAAPPNLKAVVDGFQAWLLGFATALALLAVTVAGLFYLFSAGNPAQVERAKLILRATVIGYSLMVLAPLVLTALKGIVG